MPIPNEDAINAINSSMNIAVNMVQAVNNVASALNRLDKSPPEMTKTEQKAQWTRNATLQILLKQTFLAESMNTKSKGNLVYDCMEIADIIWKQSEDRFRETY